MNANKLKAKIVEKGMTGELLAAAMNIDKSTLYRKMKEIEKFTVGDVGQIKRILELTSEETCAIFID